MAHSKRAIGLAFTYTCKHNTTHTHTQSTVMHTTSRWLKSTCRCADVPSVNMLVIVVVGKKNWVHVGSRNFCHHYQYCHLHQYFCFCSGVLHVHLQDEDGLIRLVGYPSESDRPAQDGFSSEHTNDKHLRKLSDFSGNCPKDGLLTTPCDFSSRTSSPVSVSSEQDSPVMWDLDQPALPSRMSR